jgi:hypothetical protein
MAEKRNFTMAAKVKRPPAGSLLLFQKGLNKICSISAWLSKTTGISGPVPVIFYIVCSVSVTPAHIGYCL